MIDTSNLRMIIGNWMDNLITEKGLDYLEWEDLYNAVVDFVVDTVNSNRENKKEITNEAAIEQLQKSGWMQKHDAIIGMDSLSTMINRIMLDGNKTISVNIYPWKEDGCGDE